MAFQRKHPHSRRLGAEQLEDRRLLSLTVDTPFDIVNPNDGILSLREAVFVANTVPGPFEINFDPEVFTGADRDKVIRLLDTYGELRISDTLTIDATAVDGGITITGDTAFNDSRVFGTYITDLDATTDDRLEDNIRVFHVDGGEGLTLRGLTITGAACSAVTPRTSAQTGVVASW